MTAARATRPQPIQVRADLRTHAVVRPDDRVWTPSPMSGVERCMLDRDGDEVARATSLVRYAAGSKFEAHEHALGEEFLVLEGIFSDERGHYGPLTYVRNPPGSRHAPFSEKSCTILVKLRQFDPKDLTPVIIHAAKANTQWQPGLVQGISVLPLHRYEHESVSLIRWKAGCRFRAHTHRRGQEFYVLDGTLEDEHGKYPKGTWVRSPDGFQSDPIAVTDCLLWTKTGHLPLNPTQDFSAR